MQHKEQACHQEIVLWIERHRVTNDSAGGDHGHVELSADHEVKERHNCKPESGAHPNGAGVAAPKLGSAKRGHGHSGPSLVMTALHPMIDTI